MTGSACIIRSCKNSYRNTQGLGIAFHSFPKDAKLRRIWLKRCKITEDYNPVYRRVCSTHFAPQDFERDLRNELLKLPCKKKLKANAVPTLHLQGGDTPFDPFEQSAVEREKRHDARAIRLRALERLKSLPPVQRTKDQETNTDFQDKEKMAMKIRVEKLEKRLKLVEKNLDRSMQRYEEMKRQKAAEIKQCRITLRETKMALKKTQLILKRKEKLSSKKANSVEIKPVRVSKSPRRRVPIQCAKVAQKKNMSAPTLKQRQILPNTMKKIVPITFRQSASSSLADVLPQEKIIPVISSQNKILPIQKKCESLLKKPESLLKNQYPIKFIANGGQTGEVKIWVVSS